MISLYEECLTLGLEEESDDAVYVFAESLLYLIGATGAFDFQKHIKPFCKRLSAKVFRLKLREASYTNLDLKLFMLRVAHTQATKRQMTRIADQCNISPRDSKLAYMFFTENDWFRRATLKTVRSYGDLVDGLDYQSIHAMFDLVYPTVLKYIKHITHSKLRFLVRSTNSSPSDFHSELTIKLVQAYYSIVPVQLSEAHLVNYLKRVIHHHAINMIKSGTTKKRGRMVSELDKNGQRQFNMLCLSQNQMRLTETGELQDVDGVDESASKFELRYAITEVLDRLKLKSRKYRFVSLLLGSEDKEFSEWLRNTGQCSQSEDNVDVQHSLDPNSYTQLVSEFLRVPEHHVNSFLASLRLQLTAG